MKTKLERWGKSLALRIPKPIAIKADLTEGELVDLALVDGKIIIQRSSTGYVLGDILADITSDNVHTEIDFGDPLGNEIW
jgi:antitoxin MazE